jgi:hypothetical protein
VAVVAPVARRLPSGLHATLRFFLNILVVIPDSWHG